VSYVAQYFESASKILKYYETAIFSSSIAEKFDLIMFLAKG
jgi:hypothetical protein